MPAVGVFIAFLLVGCGKGDTNLSAPVPKPVPDEGNRAIEGAGTLIKSKGGLSQVRIPKGWEEIDGLNDAAVLQVGNRQQKAYFVVRTFSKRDWPGDENHQKYAKKWVERFREFFEDTRLLSGPTELAINGRPAVQYEFAGLAPENKAHFVLLHTTVSGREHFHELVAWTNQRRVEENRSVLQAMITSFAETQDKVGDK